MKTSAAAISKLRASYPGLTKVELMLLVTNHERMSQVDLDPLEPDFWFQCTACSFRLETDYWPGERGESQRFRAEMHTLETGHRVEYRSDYFHPMGEVIEVVGGETS